jgi:hypothetical protein
MHVRWGNSRCLLLYWQRTREAEALVAAHGALQQQGVVAAPRCCCCSGRSCALTAAPYAAGMRMPLRLRRRATCVVLQQNTFAAARIVVGTFSLHTLRERVSEVHTG